MASTILTPQHQESWLQIQGQVESILIQHDLYFIPVDLIRLAEKISLTLTNATFSKLAEPGTISIFVKEGDACEVFIKTKVSRYMRRFAIAHVIGHYFLHFKDEETKEHIDNERFLLSRPTTGRVLTIEDEANQFAIELLMPNLAVRQHWNRLRSVASMAEKFDVSVEAMFERINQLGIN